jgi:hypothetical protein
MHDLGSWDSTFGIHIKASAIGGFYPELGPYNSDLGNPYILKPEI